MTKNDAINYKNGGYSKVSGMEKKKQELWTEFAGKEFYAKMAENATNDGIGNEITSTYATKETATSLTDGLLSHEDKRKLDAMDPSWLIYRVEGATGNIPKFRAEGDLEDSEIVASDVATAVQNSHSHSNKVILDEIPARNNTDNSMLLFENDGTPMKWVNWNFVNVSKKTDNSVLIGKTWYPYVKIGNYYWTTENLREPIGTLNTDYRIYKSETVEQRGYLYAKRTLLKTTDIEPEYTEMEESDALLALLHDGWHLPAAWELRQLKDLKDDYSGHEFFAIDAFDVGGVVYSRQPTDKYGFKGYPSGYYRANDGGYLKMSNYLCIASKTAAYNGQWQFWYLDLMPGSYSNVMSSMNKTAFLSVRLCKRAT
jgi:uncharacterized protein (TIGR02145 family)